VQKKHKKDIMSAAEEKELVAPEPEHCPGTESSEAGKASACDGCPNQKICASAQPQAPDPDIALIAEKLSNVKHKVLILSGKGGVGKSSVTSLLARGLASGDRNVGVLDIDICGPSLPRIFGVEGEQIHQSGSGWSPVFVDDNLSVMSAGFLLPSLDSAVIWRGPKKNGLIKQLLRDVDWGDEPLDFLLVDTPPGTSDEHLSIVQFLAQAGIDGAVIVTTPQEVALLDVRKEMDFCRKVNVPVLGIVENMSAFVCPKCKVTSEILPLSTGGAEALSVETGVPLFGRVPLDPTVGRACDEGKSLYEEQPDSPVVKVYKEIMEKLQEALKKKPM